MGHEEGLVTLQVQAEVALIKALVDLTSPRTDQILGKVRKQQFLSDTHASTSTHTHTPPSHPLPFLRLLARGDIGVSEVGVVYEVSCLRYGERNLLRLISKGCFCLHVF